MGEESNSRTTYYDGGWVLSSGKLFSSMNPATGELVWEGSATGVEQIPDIMEAARGGQQIWSAIELNKRVDLLRSFATSLESISEELAKSISLEVGKPLWEARGEVAAAVAKIEPTLDAQIKRNSTRLREENGYSLITEYRPLGIIGIIGPFNFPALMPIGQILPALIAGNVVVFKPSELTPLTGQLIAQCIDDASLPDGAFSLIHGASEIGSALSMSPNVDGVFFTGSREVGEKILKQHEGSTRTSVALEMGGNNPIIVWDPATIEDAAWIVVQSAFISAGQRCTSARRLIISNDLSSDQLLQRVVEISKQLVVGLPDAEPQPFLGTLVSHEASKAVLDAQKKLVDAGAALLLESRQPINLPNTALTPAILDVSNISNRSDSEVFGPLLQVIRVASFNEALIEANNTEFGLVASLVSDSEDRYREFATVVVAGLVNWNFPTTGSSSWAPFGGRKASGNHRPAGYSTADACVTAISRVEAKKPVIPRSLPPGVSINKDK